MIGTDRVVFHRAKIYHQPLVFEQVHCGKVFKIIDGMPVILCGNGSLLHILSMTNFYNKSTLF